MSYDDYYPGGEEEQSAAPLVLGAIAILAAIVFLFGGMVKFHPFSGEHKPKGSDSQSQSYNRPSFARPCQRTNLVLKTKKRLEDCKKAKGYAWELLKHDKEQFKCLDELWTQESGWDDEIQGSMTTNGRAQGIPQALAHGHVFDLGDWKAQVKWGVGYIRGRYGNPCKAKDFWYSRSPHWY